MAKMALTADGSFYARFFIETGATPIIPVMPSDYAGLTWWFKAEDLSPSFSQSQAVNIWPSSVSSSVYSASNSTVSTQPYYTETHFPSGNPSVYFDKGNFDRMNMVNANFGIRMSLSFVVFPASGIEGEFLSYNPLATANNQVRVFNGGGTTQPIMFYAGGSVVTLASAFSSSIKPWIATVVMDEQKHIKIYEGHKVRGEYANGVNRGHNYNETNFNLLGKENTSNTYCFTGSIAEFCAYSASSLTEDNLIALFEEYWKPKYPDLVPLGTLPSSAGVDPTTISGHRFSFIADDAAAFVLTGSNGNLVYGWSSSFDDGTGPYVATQSAAAFQPTREQNVINGRAGVYFNYTNSPTTDDLMFFPYAALTGSAVSGSEIFYVCRTVNATVGATEYQLTGGPTNFGGEAATNHHTWVDENYYESFYSNTRWNWPRKRIGEQANRYVINFASGNGSAGSWQAFFNGSSSYTNTSTYTPQFTFGTAGGCLLGTGRRDGGGHYNFWGHIFEIVHFSRKLTTQERTDVTNWLRTKYKIYDG